MLSFSTVFELNMNTATVSITCALLFGAGTAALGATNGLIFENGAPRGWRVNDASWRGVSSIAVADGHATDGTQPSNRLHWGNPGQWGAVIGEPVGPGIAGGLSLILDLYGAGIGARESQLGFVIQQPDVSGDKNWQQVWYWIGGATGLWNSL